MKKKKKSKAARGPIRSTLRYIRYHPGLYLMLIPGFVALLLFEFLPYYGIQIAFKDYNIFAGSNPLEAIHLSKWVGFAHFKKLFGSSDFLKVLKNTLVINGLRILILFPLPILIAVLLRELRSKSFRKLTQTMIYVPYFFSWVIVYGIFSSVLGSYGMLNSFLSDLGFSRLNFFTSPGLFRGILIFTDGWKSVGYGTVIYISAMMAIPPDLYEAAKVDGANKYQEIWHITLPGIMSTIVMMLILRIGNILGKGFDQVLIFYNPSVYDTADIIKTYVYRMGIGKMNFSMGTALGLFNSIISCILVVGSNYLSKKSVKRSIW